MNERSKSPGEDPILPLSGPGALCPEAQADGVPCTELGKDCPTCEKAVLRALATSSGSLDGEA